MKGERLIEAFDQAAKTHGWQSDQGTGRAVKEAEKDYKETRFALVKYVTALERQVKRLKAVDRG
jgi:hypothetical protein